MEANQVFFQTQEAQFIWGMAVMGSYCLFLSFTVWGSHTAVLNFPHVVILKSSLYTNAWEYFPEECLFIFLWEEIDGWNVKIGIKDVG